MNDALFHVGNAGRSFSLIGWTDSDRANVILEFLSRDCNARMNSQVTESGRLIITYASDKQALKTTHRGGINIIESLFNQLKIHG